MNWNHSQFLCPQPLFALLFTFLLISCQETQTSQNSEKNPMTAPTTPPAQNPVEGPPEEGDLAPLVRLKNQEGKVVDLSTFRGKSAIVLYFYPKDDTPGCTIEAQDFRDRLPEIEALGAKVFGVSLDPVDSHQSFAEKFELNFDLLADVDHHVAKSYGVLTSYASTPIAKRTTFLIGKDGKIKKIFDDVDVSVHGQEIIAALQKI